MSIADTLRNAIAARWFTFINAMAAVDRTPAPTTRKR